MARTHTRRTFLQAAPLAAAALAALPPEAMHAEDKPMPPPEKFKLISAAEFAQSTENLKARPGNFNFWDQTKLPVTAVMTYEANKSAKEFEWHEGRDHLLQVIDGTCMYEIGGAPQNGRNTRPGEWLAPASEGATTLTLHKGDWLVIPRGTPHKRMTKENVTFFLISTVGALQ